MRRSNFAISQSAPNDFQFARPIAPPTPHIMPVRATDVLDDDDFSLPPSPNVGSIGVRRLSEPMSQDFRYASSCPVSRSFGAEDDISNIQKSWKSINSEMSPPESCPPPSTILSILSTSKMPSFGSKNTPIFSSMMSISGKGFGTSLPIQIESLARPKRHVSEDELMFPMSLNESDD